jgi:hypothetical protein
MEIFMNGMVQNSWNKSFNGIRYYRPHGFACIQRLNLIKMCVFDMRKTIGYL